MACLWAIDQRGPHLFSFLQPQASRAFSEYLVHLEVFDRRALAQCNLHRQAPSSFLVTPLEWLPVLRWSISPTSVWGLLVLVAFFCVLYFLFFVFDYCCIFSNPLISE